MRVHFQLRAVVNYYCLGVQAAQGCIWRMETAFRVAQSVEVPVDKRLFISNL